MIDVKIFRWSFSGRLPLGSLPETAAWLFDPFEMVHMQWWSWKPFRSVALDEYFPSEPLVRLGSFRFAQSEWTRNRFGFGLYSHGLFRGEQIDGCRMASIYHIDCYGHGFNPEKTGSETKAISGGLNLGSGFNPDKLCSEMKGISGGLNQNVGSSSTPKVRFRD